MEYWTYYDKQHDEVPLRFRLRSLIKSLNSPLALHRCECTQACLCITTASVTISSTKLATFSLRHKHFWPPLIHPVVPSCSLRPAAWLRLGSLLSLFPILPSFTCRHMQKASDTHTQHGSSSLASHLSARPRTLPPGVGQLLSLAANVSVAQVIGTLCLLSPSSSSSFPSLRVKQRKFSQRAINIKWNPVWLVRFPFLPSFSSLPLPALYIQIAGPEPGW